MSRELLRAILKGDISKFDALIQQGVGINELTEKECWNHLHRALNSIIKPPTVVMVRHLVDSGVDVNAVDIYGNNPLNYAVRLKNESLVKVLLSAGADVNNINADGISPLREAFLSKPFDTPCIRALLDNGADVDQKTESGVSVKEYVKIVAYENDRLMQLFE